MSDAASPKKDVKSPDALFEKRKAQIQALADWPQAKPVRSYIVDHEAQLASACVFCECTLLPFIVTLFYWAKDMFFKIKPYMNGANMNDLVPAVCGFGLCFFGGTFPLTIAAIEAFKMAGWDNFKVSAGELYVEAEKALEASKKDDEESSSGDEKAVVGGDKLTRKVLVVLRVVDPEKCTTALAHLSTGALAVLASLKMAFARALTLGATIGKVLKTQVEKMWLKNLLQVTDVAYHKWIPTVIDYGTKIVAVTLAMILQHYVSAFHSALRGGQMCGVGVVRYLHRMGKVSFDIDDSLWDEGVGYSCAALGFLFQFWMGFSVPFPLWIVTFPISILEYSLSVAVACV